MPSTCEENRPGTTDEIPKQVSGSLLARIVDLAADVVVVTDREQRVLLFNKAAERTFGYRAAEVLCRQIDLCSSPAEWLHLAASVDSDLGTDRITVIGRRNGGDEFPAEVSVSSFADGDQVALVSIWRGVTERQHREALLRESEERYSALVENSMDAVLLTTPEGDILAANPEACRMFGWSEEEICQLGRTGLVDPSDPRLPALLSQRAHTGKARGELTFVRRDGTRFPAEVSSQIYRDRDGRARTSMVIHDLTALHQANLAREQQEALLNAERARAFELLEQRVAERTREVFALLEVSRNVASLQDLQSLLQVVLTQLGLVLEHSGAGIALLDQGSLRMVAYQGLAPRDKMEGMVIALDRDSGYRQVVLRQKPVIIPDIWADTPWISSVRQGWDADTLGLVNQFHSWLGVPLISRGHLIGVLRVEHSEPNHFADHHATLALAFAAQAAVAIENARLFDQARQLAVLEERQRLARELHDSVSQALYGIVLGAKTAQALLEYSPAEARQPLDYVLALAETSFAEMRALIFELSPDSLEKDGLVTALARQAQLLHARHGIDVGTDLGDEPAHLPLAAKEALYRIAQEALSNVAKHASAQHVTLRLSQEPAAVVLAVVDDGIGFNPSAPAAGHLGLRSMRERAERAGGSLQVRSQIGQGTRVDASIPLDSTGLPQSP